MVLEWRTARRARCGPWILNPGQTWQAPWSSRKLSTHLECGSIKQSAVRLYHCTLPHSCRGKDVVLWTRTHPSLLFLNMVESLKLIADQHSWANETGQSQVAYHLKSTLHGQLMMTRVSAFFIRKIGPRIIPQGFSPNFRNSNDFVWTGFRRFVPSSQYWERGCGDCRLLMYEHVMRWSRVCVCFFSYLLVRCNVAAIAELCFFVKVKKIKFDHPNCLHLLFGL